MESWAEATPVEAPSPRARHTAAHRMRSTGRVIGCMSPERARTPPQSCAGLDRPIARSDQFVFALTPAAPAVPLVPIDGPPPPPDPPPPDDGNVLVPAP